MGFVSAVATAVLKMVIFAALIVGGVFAGKKLRDRKDSKA